MSVPVSEARPQVSLKFYMPGAAQLDVGRFFSKFEFKAMLNGGYIIRAELYDASFNIQSELVKAGYFRESRTEPVLLEFQIRQGPSSAVPDGATKPQFAILLSMKAMGTGADVSQVEFVAMDPPSWFLNKGDAGGTVFKGRVDQVLRNVVNKYAPKVNVEVSRTTDSDQNKWWMMRQDPKSFISSIVDWSSSITQKKTQWLIASDGFNLAIKEQAQWVSQSRAYYKFKADGDRSSIYSWDLLSDNALSVVQSKLVAQGASAVSGLYLDRITDLNKQQVFASDKTTTNKITAKTNADQSFTKPTDADPTATGWSSIASIPEIYSAGDLGNQYSDYIDGRPRGMWLNMTNSLLRVKFEVIGHGVWSGGYGLGVDTIFIRWTQAASTLFPNNDFHWWMTGNWLVYGFHHKVSRKRWVTDLYCARFDHDATGLKVGGAGT